MATKWKWATVTGLPLTLTLDSDDPDQVALVERSAADNFISLTRIEDGEPEEAGPPPDLSDSLE